MRFVINKSLLVAFIAFQVANAQEKTGHCLDFKHIGEAHQFFAYKKGGEPIISGHRGSVENGLPENSIEAFSEVLKHTPAIFEVDPRLTKDSVIVLFHDDTLERTSTGKGRLIDHTWEELQAIRLKDRDGKVTPYKIPKLEDAIRWARGKTVLNLDKKNVPMPMIAALLKRMDAYTHVMVTVHTAEQAKYYLDHYPQQLFSAFVKTPDALQPYLDAGVQPRQMIAYIGPEIKPENQELYRLLQGKGIRAMIAAAPIYDKLASAGERAVAYRSIIADGATVLESDLPIAVAAAIKR